MGGVLVWRLYVYAVQSFNEALIYLAYSQKTYSTQGYSVYSYPLL